MGAGGRNRCTSTGLEIYFPAWNRVFTKRRGGKQRAINTYLPSSSAGHFLIKKDLSRGPVEGRLVGGWMAETPAGEEGGRTLGSHGSPQSRIQLQQSSNSRWRLAGRCAPGCDLHALFHLHPPLKEETDLGFLSVGHCGTETWRGLLLVPGAGAGLCLDPLVSPASLARAAHPCPFSGLWRGAARGGRLWVQGKPGPNV